jgi:hypothetical protein
MRGLYMGNSEMQEKLFLLVEAGKISWSALGLAICCVQDDKPISWALVDSHPDGQQAADELEAIGLVKIKDEYGSPTELTFLPEGLMGSES